MVVASHQLAEVEQLCDRVVVMDHGHKVFDGKWRDAPTFQGVVELEVDRPDQALEHAKTKGLVTDPTPQPDHHIAQSQNRTIAARWQLAPTATPADLNAALVAAGFAVHRIGLLKPQLEDLYLSLRASAQPGAASPAPAPEAAA